MLLTLPLHLWSFLTYHSRFYFTVRIKYDDKTSEVTQFPDKDVVIDDYLNGKHQVNANKFIPPDKS